jgi:hypothetical protein
MKKYEWLGLAVILFVCAAIYWPGLHGPFLFDDFPNLAALDSIDYVRSWRDLGIYLSQPRNFPGRPLAMLSFLLQKGAWPSNPFPFKLINLCIHLACGLLVYRLTTLLARGYLFHREKAPGISASTVSVAALLATAAWLLDPIQMSGVFLVVQRMTLLMALFVLLGLLAYLKGLLDEGAGELRRGAWMLLGLGVCMLLAFLSKENGILLPLYALVLDATVLRKQVARLPSKLQWWRRLLIWPTVLFVFGYLLGNLPYLASNQGNRDFTLGERLLTEPRILFDYLGNIFLPRFGLYGLYHDGFAISHSVLMPWTTLPALIGILGAAILGFVVRRRRPLLALAIFWYLGGQLLESSTVMLELYFEHRNYVPIIGPFIAIAIGLAATPEPLLRKRLLGVGVLWLVAATITTALSTSVYKSEDSLAMAWATNQPDSIRAHTMLADRLYQHGQPGLALRTVQTVLENHPGNAGLAENAAYLKCMMGTLTSVDMQSLISQVHTAPYDSAGWGNVKNLRVLVRAGRCNVLNIDSWRSLVIALLGNPNYSNGISRGYLHYQLHESAVAEGNLDEAVRQLDAAWATDPDAEIPRLEARYLASAGLYDQAIATLQKVDYSHLPLLRRLLVDDRSINNEAIEILRKQKAAHTKPAPNPALLQPSQSIDKGRT